MKCSMIDLIIKRHKYAIGVLQSKIKECESVLEGIGEIIEPDEEDEKKKVTLEKAQQTLKEMQDYGDELKYRVILNECHMDREFKKEVEMLNEIKEDREKAEEKIDREYREFMEENKGHLAKRVKRYVLAKVKAEDSRIFEEEFIEEAKEKAKENELEDVTWLSNQAKDQLKEMTLEEIVKRERECMGGFLYSLEKSEEDIKEAEDKVKEELEDVTWLSNQGLKID